MTIVEGGGASPGIEERGGEGVPVMTQRAVEKMVMGSGTQSPERREPLIRGAMEG